MISFLKKYAKHILAGLAVVAVLGVGYFDTYPTYISKSLVLTERECSEVATIVAVQGFKTQDPSQPIPDEVVKAMKDASRKAKRVANYIIEKNPEVLQMPPAFVYQQLTMSCLVSGGKAELK